MYGQWKLYLLYGHVIWIFVSMLDSKVNFSFLAKYDKSFDYENEWALSG